MTNQLEGKIREEIARTESMGGAVKAIEAGYPQKAVAEEAYRMAREEEKGERIVVGVNKFQMEEKERHLLVLHHADVQAVKRKIQRTKEVNVSRMESEVQKTLDPLSRAAETKENLMPYFIAAVKSYASIEEITGALKKVFGESREPVNI